MYGETASGWLSCYGDRLSCCRSWFAPDGVIPNTIIKMVQTDSLLGTYALA